MAARASSTRKGSGSGAGGAPESPAASAPTAASGAVSANAGGRAPEAGLVRARAGQIESYETAIAYLNNRVDLERVRATGATKHAYRLDRMRAICDALGRPQDAVRAIHVAGTKGKGSTCEMVAAAMEASGYTVGLYTSPHVEDVRERVRINRQMISPADFAASVRRVGEAAEAIEAKHGDATYFELLTAAAFVYFAEQAVDAAVIEVGLGGLLDCTNVITPEVAVVTLIGMDHTEILGDTPELIARQKAGIYKAGVPALTFAQDKAVVEVLRKCAEEVGAPFSVLGKDIDFSFRSEFVQTRGAGAPRADSVAAVLVGPQAFVTLTGEHAQFEHVPVPLRGDHQALNCGLALAVLDQLAARGFTFAPDDVVRGLESVRLAGRFEVVSASPRVVVDVAHNPESIQALMRTIGQQLPSETMVCVFGCAADKDIPAMLRHLAAGADKVIFTAASGNARAARPADLFRKFDAISGGKMAQTARSPAEAIDLALRAAGRDALVCVTGSFYLVGEARALLAARGLGVRK